MNNQDLIPHLFREEYRKIVAVLCRRFGFEQMETAEDIASQTFLAAAQTWSLNGIPKNPVAWLYNVAKNNAKNYLQRDHLFTTKIAPEIKQTSTAAYENEIDLSPQNISDSQLQMMFAICHPAIPPEAQVGLSLRILCGFGIDEIADAFLSNRETITKRLFRAREKLRDANISIALPPPAEIDNRLDTVLATLYLLFSEGYYSASQDTTLRRDLCLEAMRLCYMLVENDATNKPPVNALLSLMCFHASRFEARISENGEQVLYNEQDTTLWNQDLIRKGAWYLKCATTGDHISRYHLEASIAYWYTQKEDTTEKWDHMLQLHNRLLQIAYSPIAALNRTYAFSKVYGKVSAIKEAEKLKLEGNHFYFTLLGELYTGIDDIKTNNYYQQALQLAKTHPEQQLIRKKIDQLPS
ncbi:MAG TPA: sigma-70 family RNA polymerase sigma factor [Chitinophaga sp.]|uniref:RNA polymerase sigma factor n=1 Tax=Chitinophaga sp. TaxID=1869181 RepID=UPI002BF93058|nr:sigma-70 family RNA polymerase sigma factor [Chitinophaga sp.]HVI44169.1 sigma-70 family RNA polymerase sigma factor [Chitinophaga sp.]